MTQDSVRKLIDMIEQTEVKVKTETNNNAGMFYNKLIDGFRDVLLYEGYCAECGEELKTIKITENRGECQGFHAFEDVETYVYSNGHKFE